MDGYQVTFYEIATYDYNNIIDNYCHRYGFIKSELLSDIMNTCISNLHGDLVSSIETGNNYLMSFIYKNELDISILIAISNAGEYSKTIMCYIMNGKNAADNLVHRFQRGEKNIAFSGYILNKE